MADQSAQSTDIVSPTEVETELVGESLVEEVSIDGMCGVY
ncbi:MAG: mycofactocin precursor MftA [Gordonia sp. (in: high G+C Gram-positive bacteria)]